MPHPYVTSAEIKGDYIEIGVETDDYAAGSYIEISGHATQTGGAFANFYAIAKVPGTPPSTTTTTTATTTTITMTTTNNTDGEKDSSVYVEAHPLPPNQFKKDEDVTIVVRVGKVWLTVLGRTVDLKTERGQAAGDGTRWDQLRRWSEVNRSSDSPDGYPPPKGSSSPASGSSFPADGSSSLASGPSSSA
jgi:hypothetical protein